MIRNEARVVAVWERIRASERLREASDGMDETWDSVKSLIPKKERLRDIYTIEAEYLSAHPNSGYLTEILPLTNFPDYIDYLPRGSIVRKIGVMGYIPSHDDAAEFIAVSRREYDEFVDHTVMLVTEKFAEKKLF